MSKQDYEKLGVFYLGREYDPAKRAPKRDLVLLDSKDLVTHAVIVGMTGSGKTGLGIALLEEAAIDGIPALIIDPKGDLSNLLLTFPDLKPASFALWVNPADAQRKGLAPEAYAKQQAELWKKGLAEWDQDGARIQRLRDAVEIALYTPGSTAGRPLSILQSFSAPPQELRDDEELFRERVATSVTSLLALLGNQDDPLQSREHILLSTILAQAWNEGEDLELPQLIQRIQTPEFSRVGLVELESFFPAKERFALSMQINNLLASPAFGAWLEGEPLDVGSLLYTPEGKPRLAILSIAHLGDKERMFFVSLLLNQALTWMRSQPGTTSLRALIYMDEIFGYFPPVANPPSKLPLLTLLKQARAFGLGVVLATQNPVDLDYKGLSNTGAWFVGRLQTERDKDRLLDGLEGAATATGSAFERASMDRLLSGLENRVFLMNNVHDDGPCLFQVRWVMSYLRGPLTRAQIRGLADEQARPETKAEKKKEAAPQESGAARPMLPPDVPQFFVPPFTPPPPGCSLVYMPRALGIAQVYLRDAKRGIDHDASLTFLAVISDDAISVSWADAKSARIGDKDLSREPASDAVYGPLPSAAAKVKSYDAWKKALADFLYRDYAMDLFQSPALGEVSQPGESEAAFRARLALKAREARDLKAEKLRAKYAPKLATIKERIRKAQAAVQTQQSQSSQSKIGSVLSVGTSILGAFLGRKKLSVTNVSRASTAAKSVGKTMKEAQDVEQAKQNVAALERQHADLEAQFQAEVQEVELNLNPATEELKTLPLKPKKTDIQVKLLALAWAPFWKSREGFLSAAWRQ